MLPLKLPIVLLALPLFFPAAAAAQADLPPEARPAAMASVFVFRDGGRRAPRGEPLLERLMGTHALFVDDWPVAELTRFSFAPLQVEPGWHLLWGGSDPEWFEFKAGRPYVVQIREGEGQNGAGAWRLSPPGDIEKRIATLGLERVEPSEESLARLREELRSYERIRSRAGAAPVSAEVEVKGISYFEFAPDGTEGRSRGSVLSVTAAGLVYESGDVRLQIAKPEFEAFGYLEAVPSAIGVTYRRDGTTHGAVFIASDNRDHNRALLAIQNLLAD